MIMKKVFAIICSMMLVFLCACDSENVASSKEVGANNNDPVVTLNIAYQYGLAYAPLILCQENQLIEEKYKEISGKDVNVVWNQMSSGADINTGITSGSLNVGFMGVAPAITGISKNVGYKIFTNISGQEHGLMSNDDSIKSLSDLVGSDKQLALVNIGSIQHIILGKALSANGFDAHALDSNIVAMKHPDGMTSLETGNVSCHLTSNPYIYKERENSSLHELEEVKTIWSAQDSFIVGVASTNLHDGNPELYSALCNAVAQAIDTINKDREEVAKITCEYDGNSYDDELKYLSAGYYSTQTKGISDLANFMSVNGFIDNKLNSYSEIVFDNVTGD